MMRVPGFGGRPETELRLPLEQQREVGQLELDPFTFDLHQVADEEATERDRERAHEQLRRQLIEEIFPHTIHPVRERRLADVYERIHSAPRPVHALCLSGGGIRSASFSFGVLQALARARWLSFFDYLSTVSGGGYIGGWLSAWIYNEGAEDARKGLAERSTERLLEPEAPAIRHLRTYANYLSPKLGLLSADTWTLASTYLRNLVLNWLVLVPLLTAVLLVPWIAVANVSVSQATFDGFAEPLMKTLFLAGAALGLFPVYFTHRNRPESSGRRDVSAIPEGQRKQSAFLKWCLAPLALSVALLSTALVWARVWNVYTSAQLLLYSVVTGAGIHALGFVLAGLASEWTWRPNTKTKILITLWEFVLVLASGAAAGALAYVILSAPSVLTNPRMYVWLAAPVFMLLVMFASFLFTGFGSRFANDAEREWSARFAAWILIPVVSWLAVAGIVLFGPELLHKIRYGNLISFGTALLTGTSVAAFGNSAATSATAAAPQANGGGRAAPAATSATAGAGRVLRIIPVSALLTAGSLLFTALLIVGLSMLGLSAVRELACARRGCPELPWTNLDPVEVLAVALGFLVVGLVMARFVDTNRFSLHAMYRARLMRTFLGASRRGTERRPDPFTGFDEQDDLPMSALGINAPLQRPLHVVNMALNLVGGTNLAWQNRKARSFTVSPLYAGSVGLGYRPVCPRAGMAQRIYGGENGISLGTAVTISGAAASPNMGYHSSPLVTFLMTFFNLRLGWWLGNPGPAGNESFFRAQPTLAVRPIVDELFGRTNDRNKYVYLSDGGHFENLGLYEMVLRRCSRIVVVDASADPEGTFGDLANAMRLISIDLGVPITFDQNFRIFARGTNEPVPHAYWAEGTIDYAAVDGGAALPGKIYYLKPTFYRTEPRDIFSYAQASRQFPHEPTTDQFFSEAQLESYRALGNYIGDAFIRELQTRYPANPPGTWDRLP